jgi:ABC-type amino acid transport substrate-binding protein
MALKQLILVHPFYFSVNNIPFVSKSPFIKNKVFKMNISINKKRYVLLFHFLFLIAFFALFIAPVCANDTGKISPRIIVGTKQAPPFAMKNNEGEWEGLSIELWDSIATELDLQYELREFTLPELLEGLENQTIDVVAAALTITAEREKRIDFSHPFHISGLGIAVQPGAREGWLAAIKKFVSLDFLKILSTLVLLIGIMGFLVWFFEREHNRDQFGGPIKQGIWDGFWWSAVTMTTVGYGDKAPKSLGGRIVALIWMFTAVIVISSFTAAVTSSLTVANIKSRVKNPADLKYVRVGTLPQTTSSSYLDKEHILYSNYKNVQNGLDALTRNEIDAFVYDAPILRYMASMEYKKKVLVLNETFQKQLYGFGLWPGSSLREPMNQVLLQKINAPEWQDTVYKYLGR